jgi:hypothetical protein
MAQVVECLPSKLEALSSNPCTIKKGKQTIFPEPGTKPSSLHVDRQPLYDTPLPTLCMNVVLVVAFSFHMFYFNTVLNIITLYLKSLEWFFPCRFNLFLFK